MKKLTLKEKISYGFGDFGNGFMFDLGQSYLLKFFTDIVGIAAGAAGAIFLVTKLFDAFMDPLAGSLIDSRKDRSGKGKFRPFLIGAHTYCVTDPSKLGKHALISYARLQDVSGIITNKSADPEKLHELEQQGANFVLV